MKKINTITDRMYTDFIRSAIHTDGYRVAEAANKLALESHQITLEQYRIAARIIADAFLEAIEKN